MAVHCLFGSYPIGEAHRSAGRLNTSCLPIGIVTLQERQVLLFVVVEDKRKVMSAIHKGQGSAGVEQIARRNAWSHHLSYQRVERLPRITHEQHPVVRV